MPLPETEKTYRLYSDLSWVWPIISPPEDYLEEGEEIAATIYKHTGGQNKTLLDLGCGGGHCDFALKKQFRITGIDQSEQMLSLARQLNPDIEYFKGDIRNIRLEREFDAALLHDAVNYMLSEQDLERVFKTAFIHLRSGGILWTSAEITKENFKQNKTCHTAGKKGDLEIVFIENYYDSDPEDTTYEAVFLYLIRHEGRLQIETDRHYCGVFPLTAWISLLSGAGFEVIQGEFTAEKYPMFVCIKP